MTVMLRGKKFAYRFQLNGQDYSGSCPGCEASPEDAKAVAAARIKALAYEKQIRTNVAQEADRLARLNAEMRYNKTARALLENYRQELSGGRPIALAEAYELAAAKPARREARSAFAAMRQTYWNDFTAFMAATFPEVATLGEVRRMHCEAYVAQLRDHGRFAPEISYTVGKRSRQVLYAHDYQLSGRTIHEIVGICKWVFTRLAEDAGVYPDPWAQVVLPERDATDRQIFTPDELKLIQEHLNEDYDCRVLFTVAAATGLTEGDICTLKWSEIDWASKTILHMRRKTGVPLQIPMLPSLVRFLGVQPRTSDYLFPRLAELYLQGNGAVSTRVKDFLNRLGIVNQLQRPGRRAISVKDLHSMRHVFCTYAGQAGIPLSIVQSIVGHLTPAMTEHYASHVTLEAKQQAIAKLPDFLNMETA